MFTEFFRPSDFTTKHITETTFVLEKKLTEQLSLFTEYVGDYPDGADPRRRGKVVWSRVLRFDDRCLIRQLCKRSLQKFYQQREALFETR